MISSLKAFRQPGFGLRVRHKLPSRLIMVPRNFFPFLILCPYSPAITGTTDGMDERIFGTIHAA